MYIIVLTRDDYIIVCSVSYNNAIIRILLYTERDNIICSTYLSLAIQQQSIESAVYVHKSKSYLLIYYLEFEFIMPISVRIV